MATNRGTTGASQSARPTRRISDTSATRTQRPARARAREQSSAPGPRSRDLAVNVVWGDITKVEADVLMCGHYVGVMPQRGELCLDQLVSGWTPSSKRELIITELTRRGAVHGDIGEIYFFPCPGERLVAIAGIGQLGTFRASQARALGRTVAQVVGLLPHQRSLATLLVGSGEGNLKVNDAVRSFGDGIVEALADNEHLNLERLTIVERNLDRALEVHDAVRSWANAPRGAVGNQQTIRIECAPKLTDGVDGKVTDRFGCSMLLAAIASASGEGRGAGVQDLVDGLLEKLPDVARADARTYLLGTETSRAERAGLDLRELAMRFRLQANTGGAADQSIPARIAFARAGDDIRVAAITNTTTAAEQVLRRRAPTLIEASKRLQNADAKEWMTNAREVERLVVPREFRPILEGLEPLIIEVDRSLAQVPWELLPGNAAGNALSLRRSVSRQLRTRYSPHPFGKAPDRRYRALIIGDPADEEHRLEEARDEALHVTKVLTDCEITCDLLIGPPEDGTGAGPQKGIRAADYGRVISMLQSGEYDIVHFCGHAFFDATSPEMSGWLFKGGVLTASELIGMERPPLLVVANACESVLLSLPQDDATGDLRRRGDSSARARAGGDEGTLVAGLADEFFKQGVIDYIGTAWPVPSGPAKAFAEVFYRGVFASGQDRKSIGDAILQARNECKKTAPPDGIVWGAYQHYGDPTRMFPEPSVRVSG